MGRSEEARPAGCAVKPCKSDRSAANKFQGRTDCDVTLDTISHNTGLGFTSVQRVETDPYDPSRHQVDLTVRLYFAGTTVSWLTIR